MTWCLLAADGSLGSLVLVMPSFCTLSWSCTCETGMQCHARTSNRDDHQSRPTAEPWLLLMVASLPYLELAALHQLTTSAAMLSYRSMVSRYPVLKQPHSQPPRIPR